MKKVIPDGSVLVPDEAQQVFAGQIFSVYQWPQTLFDGSLQTFEMLKRTDTVTAICVVEDKLLVLQDEQPHMGKRRSFPGGRVDPNDASLEAAAQREILEETGYSFNNWRLVQARQPYRKIEWFVYLFLAWDVADAQAPHLDGGEKIELQKLDFAAVKELVGQRVGYLGESAELFEPLKGVADLLTLPEFSGPVVER